MTTTRSRLKNDNSIRAGRGPLIFGFTLLCFAVGTLFASSHAEAADTNGESARVFELRIYHVVPGKLSALEARFRDVTSKLLAEHGLKVVGYWVPEPGDKPAWNNTFMFMVAHASRDDAKKNWDALRADPRFQELVKAEQSEKLVESVDSTYMRSTEFSDMK